MAGMPYFSQVPFWTCGKPRPRGTYPFYLAVGGFVPRFQTWTGDGRYGRWCRAGREDTAYRNGTRASARDHSRL